MLRTATLAVALGAAMTTQAAGPKITLYSGDYDAVLQSDGQAGGPGFALVQQPLTVPLRDGAAQLTLDTLPLALDAGSVQLRGEGLRVRGQRYDFATPGQSALLQRALGQRISVEQSAGGELRRFSGVLLAAGDGLTLREDSGAVRVLSGFSSFTVEAPLDGLVSRPTLRLDVAGSGDGERAATLDYATAGLGWRAEYHARLALESGRCRMDWQGNALVANRSGSDFRDVRLTLVAGQPNRVQGGAPRGGVVMAMAAPEAKMLQADAVPEAGDSGEYHSYTLPAGGDLPHGSLQRLSLLAPANGVPCERRYEAGGAMGWVPPQPLIDRNFGSFGEMPVGTVLAFRNDRAAGLGVALPAGRVRVFDGEALLGEATLGHTAAGRDVRLALGTAFDLTAERRSEAFTLDRDGRTMTETLVVVVRNAKREAATVHLTEALPRWTDWEITASSLPVAKRDAQTAQFAVPVPAGGETELRYTVRYRWAPDVQIP